MPLISVIIPFHNRVEWTCEAIDSVLCQTFQDFEIILINDGSTEDVSKLSCYLPNKKIIYIKQDKSGAASARNKGLCFSQGEFIAFLDSDDLFYPEKLERQLSLMQNNSSILLSHTSYELIDKNRNFLETKPSGNYIGNVFPQILLFCPIATPTVMIRKQVCIENHLLFEEEAKVAEDVLFWSEFAKRSNIFGINEPLTKVRVHSNSTFSNRKMQIVGYKNIIKYGIEKDTFLTSKQKKTTLASCHTIISSLFFKESELKNSLKFSFLAMRESFSTWVKMVLKAEKIIRISNAILSYMINHIKNNNIGFHKERND